MSVKIGLNTKSPLVPLYKRGKEPVKAKKYRFVQSSSPFTNGRQEKDFN